MTFATSSPPDRGFEAGVIMYKLPIPVSGADSSLGHVDVFELELQRNADDQLLQRAVVR